jgi:hypothetical protein
MTRLDRLAKLMASYSQVPEDYDEGEEEDPRPYFTGEAELARYVCVTVNYTSHGEPKFFFLPTFDDPQLAQERAVEYAQDDLFEELPVEVYDLDSGCSFTPDWTSLQWERGPVGPCSGAQS